MLRLVLSLTAGVLVVMAAFGDIRPDGYSDIGGPVRQDLASGQLATSDGTVILTAAEIDRIAALATQTHRQPSGIVVIDGAGRGESRAARMQIENIQHVALTRDAPAATATRKVTTPGFAPGHLVSGSGVNLRSGPGINHAKLRRLPRGAPVQVLSRNVGGWAQLRTADGTVGFMSTDYLSLN